MGTRRSVIVALLAALALVSPAPAGAIGGPRETRVDARESVGPGTTLMRIREPGPGGPVAAFVLKVDLTDPAVRAGLLYPGSVAGVEKLSVMARTAGAFAAINGDYFNIGASGEPVGPIVSDGQLIKGPQPGRALAIGVGENGLGRIATVGLRGYVGLPSGRVPLVDLNDANPGYRPMLAPNGIGVFTSAWGTYPRYGAVRGLSSVAQALVVNGRVVRVRPEVTAGPIPSDGYLLLGAGSGGRRLAGLRVGQPVTISYAQRTPGPGQFAFAIGGKYWLVRAGVVQRNLPAAPGAERTAAGFSDDGRTMWLVATEGREAGVPGLDLPGLAIFMHSLGVRNAVDLDDGGSTTIVVRLPGHVGLTVLNHPADGRERRVADGIGLFATGRRAQS